MPEKNNIKKIAEGTFYCCVSLSNSVFNTVYTKLGEISRSVFYSTQFPKFELKALNPVTIAPEAFKKSGLISVKLPKDIILTENCFLDVKEFNIDVSASPKYSHMSESDLLEFVGATA